MESFCPRTEYAFPFLQAFLGAPSLTFKTFPFMRLLHVLLSLFLSIYCIFCFRETVFFFQVQRYSL